MITLTLENIRCFGKQRFTFDLNSFTLVTGPSGVGKSTLFLALTFAITGESKHLCSLGKRKCNVTLVTPHITITRSKGPNKLIAKVGEVTYEEKVAQGYINQVFPNFELGYIPQKLHKSFLAKTPAQKLEFIESFAFDLEYLTKLLTNCKGLLSERKLAHTKAQQHLTTSENVLVKHNIPKVTEQPCSESLEELRKQLAEVTQEIEQCNENMVVTRERMTQRQEALEAYNNMVHLIDPDSTVTSIKALLRSTTEQELQWGKYQDALSSLNKLPVPDKEINLTALRQEANTLANNHKIQVTLQKKQAELEKHKATLLTLSSLPLDAPLYELDGTLQEYVDAHTKGSKSEDLTKELKEAEVKSQHQDTLLAQHYQLSDQVKVLTLKHELQQLEEQKQELIKVQQCPYCREHVSIWNGTLEKAPSETGLLATLKSVKKKLFDPSLQEQQAALDKQIQELNLNIEIELRRPNYVEPTMTLAELTNELTRVRSQQLSSRDYSKLKTRMYNLSSRASEASAKALSARLLLTTLKQKFQVQDDPLVLAQNISKIKKVTLEVNNLTKVIESLKEQLQNPSTDLTYEEAKRLINITEPYVKAQEKVNLYKCSPSEYSSKNLEQTLQNKIRLEELTKVLRQTTPEFDLEELSITHEHLQERLSTLKSNLELTKAYLMWHDVALAKEDLSQAEIALARSHKLQGLITEAKKEALDEVLERITTYTQMYLDEFFSEPISLEITFTDKVVLNLIFRDTKIDLDALSGGEFARVNLAITLALADMYQVDLLLIDESLASLDHTTSTKVLKAIKKLYQGTVLCVAHQTVTGTFDKCIELGK